MSFAESQRATMIKQRRYRSSATPQSDESAPPAPGSTPATAAPIPAADVPRSDKQKAEPRTGEGQAKGAELGEQIGHTLKAMFEDVVAEPVPEKFRQLLEQLERKPDKS
jgi:anti-sigma factor NepR-like protein